MWRDHYVDTPGSAYNENPPGVESGLLTDEMRAILDRYEPPDDDIRAYHKHDCLCVLGRGPDAIDQLYRWVAHIRKHGGQIISQDRETVPGTDHPINWLLHGRQHAVLVFDA